LQESGICCLHIEISVKLPGVKFPFVSILQPPELFGDFIVNYVVAKRKCLYFDGKATTL
jgi:hypothetical protein